VPLLKFLRDYSKGALTDGLVLKEKPVIFSSKVRFGNHPLKWRKNNKEPDAIDQHSQSATSLAYRTDGLDHAGFFFIRILSV
jgi:hypothetical protein